MKRILKGSALLLAVLMLVINCLFITAYADESSVVSGDVSAQGSEKEEEAAEPANDGQMNLDVVFVLDASGSMTKSDPKKIAIDAYRLFVDLLDESCGIGYVVYTHEIIDKSDIVDISDKEALEATKTKMASIKYDLDGFTDIALGLTEAKDILTSKKYKDDHRQKVIILLTDGNTALPKGGRTLDESNDEMDATLMTLYDRKIPVYSIGLNYNGKMKAEELEKISGETDGVNYETKSSEDLVGIFSDIFAHIYQLDGEVKEIIDGNVDISVADNSVFTVSIIIRSRFTLEELAPKLTDPFGKDVSLKDNEDIKVTSTGSYVMIKIFYPEEGDWNLHLEKVDNSNCTVTQMDYYSIFIAQEVKSVVRTDDEIMITATVKNKEGIVDDKRLLDTLRLKATVKSSKGREISIAMHTEKTGVYTGIWVPDTPGMFTVTSVATTPKFTKNSNSVSVEVMTPEQYAEYLSANGISEVSEDSKGDNSGWGWVALIVIVIAVIVVVGVILIIAAIRVKRERALENRLATAAPEEPAPRPRPQQPIKTVQEPSVPATPPELVDYELIEHDKIENLIKKGPEDPFHMNVDDIKADASLEALIKKGPDNTFGSGFARQPKLAEEMDDDEDEDEEEEEEVGENDYGKFPSYKYSDDDEEDDDDEDDDDDELDERK